MVAAATIQKRTVADEVVWSQRCEMPPRHCIENVKEERVNQIYAVADVADTFQRANVQNDYLAINCVITTEEKQAFIPVMCRAPPNSVRPATRSTKNTTPPSERDEDNAPEQASSFVIMKLHGYGQQCTHGQSIAHQPRIVSEHVVSERNAAIQQQ